MQWSNLFYSRFLNKSFQHICNRFLPFLPFKFFLLLVFIFFVLFTYVHVVSWGSFVGCENFIVARYLRLSLLNFLCICQQTYVTRWVVHIKMLLQIVKHIQLARTKHFIHFQSPLKHHLLFGLFRLHLLFIPSFVYLNHIYSLHGLSIHVEIRLLGSRC